jgi:hypothetical protein
MSLDHNISHVRLTSQHLGSAVFVAGRYALSMPASRSDSVDFEFIDHRRGAASKYSWLPPFDWTVAYENERWWDEPRHYYVGQPWFVQVLADGDEVARIELDDPGGIHPQYVEVPKLGAERLEIQFIEVAIAARGRNIGTKVVRAIELRHPARRLFAYSEEAHGFWASLGWERFDHPKESGSIGRCSSSRSSSAGAQRASRRRFAVGSRRNSEAFAGARRSCNRNRTVVGTCAGGCDGALWVRLDTC